MDSIDQLFLSSNESDCVLLESKNEVINLSNTENSFITVQQEQILKVKLEAEKLTQIDDCEIKQILFTYEETDPLENDDVSNKKVYEFTKTNNPLSPDLFSDSEYLVEGNSTNHESDDSEKHLEKHVVDDDEDPEYFIDRNYVTYDPDYNEDTHTNTKDAGYLINRNYCINDSESSENMQLKTNIVDVVEEPDFFVDRNYDTDDSENSRNKYIEANFVASTGNLSNSSSDRLIYNDYDESESWCEANASSSSCDESLYETDYSTGNEENISKDSDNTPEEKKRKTSKRCEVELRKRKRNSGQAYTTLKGRKREKRESQKLKICKSKCAERVSDELRLQCFNEYWSVLTYIGRLAFLSKCLKVDRKRRITNLINPKRQRNISVKYFLTNRITLEEINVCRSCFLDVLGEKVGILGTVIKKQQEGAKLTDNRGTSSNKSKITSSQEEAVRNHIKSFPKYESHYSRSHTQKNYLPIGLNLSKMYEMYIEMCSEKTVSLSKYREIFKTFNLKFKRPQLDTCQKCDKFALQIKLANDENKSIIQKDRDNHQEMAELAYANKRIDKCDQNKTVLAVDLQQCLPTPYLKSNIAFYKRSLWTFNFTIRNCDDNSTYCFVWHEAMSGRGANEISSCLYKYLMSANNLKQHVVIYSDTCGGQNRNNIVCSMFQYLLEHANHTFHTIEHKFLEPGHTHLECDSDHKTIEDKKKRSNMEIFHPHDWAQLMRMCGKNKKFNVIEMKNHDFYDFAQLLKTKYKKPSKTDSGQKIVWNNIRILRYTKDLSGGVDYLTNHAIDAEVYRMNTIRFGNKSVKLQQLHPTENVLSNYISKEKHKDLLDLLQFIPQDLHDFYKNLPVKNYIRNTIFLNESDEE